MKRIDSEYCYLYCFMFIPTSLSDTYILTLPCQHFVLLSIVIRIQLMIYLYYLISWIFTQKQSKDMVYPLVRRHFTLGSWFFYIYFVSFTKKIDTKFFHSSKLCFTNASIEKLLNKGQIHDHLLKISLNNLLSILIFTFPLCTWKKIFFECLYPF